MSAIRRPLQLRSERPRCRGFRTRLLALGGALVGVLVSAPALASRIETILEPFTGSPSSVRVALEDGPGSGQILLSVEVIEGVADIRGVFFDMANDSLLADLDVTGDWVTSFDVDACGGVIREGGGNNLYGGDSPCPCDVGVQIGTPGIAWDDIRSTSFVLSHPDISLSLFLEQEIGVRLTSVGVDEYHRRGSSKLGGVLPVPEPRTGLLVASGLIGLALRGRSAGPRLAPSEKSDRNRRLVGFLAVRRTGGCWVSFRAGEACAAALRPESATRVEPARDLT